MAININFYKDRVKFSLSAYFCLLFLFLLFKVFSTNKVKPTSSEDMAFAVAILEASIAKSPKKPEQKPEPPKEREPVRELTEAEIEKKLQDNISRQQKEEQAKLETSIKIEAERAEKERLEKLEKERLERLEKEKLAKLALEKKQAEQKALEQKKKQEELAKQKEKELKEREKQAELERQKKEMARREAEEKRKIQEQKVAVEADYRDPTLNNTKPKQPLSSVRAGEQGEVLLSVRVAPDGTVVDVTIAKSSGYVRLDNAAMYAIKTWRFKPAKNIFGQNIASTSTISFRFDLTSGD